MRKVYLVLVLASIVRLASADFSIIPVEFSLEGTQFKRFSLVRGGVEKPLLLMTCRYCDNRFVIESLRFRSGNKTNVSVEQFQDENKMAQIKVYLNDSLSGMFLIGCDGMVETLDEHSVSEMARVDDFLKAPPRRESGRGSADSQERGQVKKKGVNGR